MRHRSCTRVMLGPEPTFYCSCTPVGVQSMCYACIYDHREHNYFICDIYEGACQCAEFNAACNHSGQALAFKHLCLRQDGYRSLEHYLARMQAAYEIKLRVGFGLNSSCTHTYLTQIVWYITRLAIRQPGMLKRISTVEPLRSYFVNYAINRYTELTGPSEVYELLISMKDQYSAIGKAQAIRLYARHGALYQNMTFSFALYYPQRFFSFVWEDVFMAEAHFAKLWDANEVYENSTAQTYYILHQQQNWTSKFACFTPIVFRKAHLSKKRVYAVLDRVPIVECPKDHLLVCPQFLLALLMLRVFERGGSEWTDMNWRVTDDGLSAVQRKMNQLLRQLVNNYNTCCGIACGTYKRNCEDLQAMLSTMVSNGTYRYAELNAYFALNRYCLKYRPGLESVCAAAAHKISFSNEPFSELDASIAALAAFNSLAGYDIADTGVLWQSGQTAIDTVHYFCDFESRPYYNIIYTAKSDYVRYQDFLFIAQRCRHDSEIVPPYYPWTLDFPVYSTLPFLQEFYDRLRGHNTLPNTEVQPSLSDRLARLRARHSNSSEQNSAFAYLNDDYRESALRDLQAYTPTDDERICDLCHEYLGYHEFMPVVYVHKTQTLYDFDLWIACGHRLHCQCALSLVHFAKECPICGAQAAKLLHLSAKGRGLQELFQECSEERRKILDLAAKYVILQRGDVNIADQIMAFKAARALETARDPPIDARLTTLRLRAVLLPYADLLTEYERLTIHTVEPQLSPKPFVLPNSQLEILEAQCSRCGEYPYIAQKLYCTQCGLAFHPHCFAIHGCRAPYIFYPKGMLVYDSGTTVAFRAPYRNFRGELPRNFFGPKFLLDAESLALLRANLNFGQHRINQPHFCVPTARVPDYARMPLVSEEADDYEEAFPQEV